MKKFDNLEQIIQSSLASDKLQAEIAQIRQPHGKARIHGFVTVIHTDAKTGKQTVLCQDKKNLLTNAGRDAMHDALYIDTSATQVGFNFIALTVNTAAPLDTDTTLTGEITSGGLTRILASTRTHTVGTNVSTVQHTFTATATHTNVQKSGLFDLVAVGIMAHENTFTPVTLQNNDTLQVTWTLTLDD